MDNEKYLEQINSDIFRLMDLIQDISTEINDISSQLDIRQDNGDETYPEWKAKALSARRYKKSELSAAKSQKHFWLQEKSVVIKNINKANNESMKKRSNSKEVEKTERHKANMIRERDLDIQTHRQFRSFVKEIIGEDEYSMLMQKSREIAENNLELNEG